MDSYDRSSFVRYVNCHASHLNCYQTKSQNNDSALLYLPVHPAQLESKYNNGQDLNDHQMGFDETALANVAIMLEIDE